MIQTIVNTVFIYFKMNPSLCNSESRKRELVICRQVSWYFIKKYIPRKSLEDIGSDVGNKNHATVLYGINNVNNLIDTDKMFLKSINDLTQLIESSETADSIIGKLKLFLSDDLFNEFINKFKLHRYE